MVEIRVLNEDDIVDIYTYRDKNALLEEYNSDSIHVNGIDFDTLMKLMEL